MGLHKFAIQTYEIADDSAHYKPKTFVRNDLFRKINNILIYNKKIIGCKIIWVTGKWE